MKKTLKLLTVIFMVAIMVLASTSNVFASDVIDAIDQKIDLNGAATKSEGLIGLAGKVISLIQIGSAIAAAILVAVFGFKFIMGSAEQKSDYQKSFIPLIVGVVVVFSATSIAKLLFTVIG